MSLPVASASKLVAPLTPLQVAFTYILLLSQATKLRKRFHFPLRWNADLFSSDETHFSIQNIQFGILSKIEVL